MRKKTILGLAMLACAGVVSPVVSASPGPARGRSGAKVFLGEIWDSACATAANHASMASVVGADPKNAAQCTRMCVEAGAKYVLLVDHSDQITYELDDQEKAKEFAGKKVKITGRLKGEVLLVSTIQALQ